VNFIGIIRHTEASTAGREIAGNGAEIEQISAGEFLDLGAIRDQWGVTSSAKRFIIS